MKSSKTRVSSFAWPKTPAPRRELRRKHNPSLVLLDIWMPDADGVTLLKEWKAAGLLTMPVVMLSGHATIETAVEATRIGAFDFLEKPIGLQSCCRPYSARAVGGPNAPAPSITLTLAKVRSSTNCALASKLVNERRTALLTGEVGVGFIGVCAGIARTQYTRLVLESGQRLISSPLEILESARGGTLILSGSRSSVAQRAAVTGLHARQDWHLWRTHCLRQQ